jgi:hypothetical protein
VGLQDLARRVDEVLVAHDKTGKVVRDGVFDDRQNSGSGSAYRTHAA